jgi:hypothetical protein
MQAISLIHVDAPQVVAAQRPPAAPGGFDHHLGMPPAPLGQAKGKGNVKGKGIAKGTGKAQGKGGVQPPPPSPPPGGNGGVAAGGPGVELDPARPPRLPTLHFAGTRVPTREIAGTVWAQLADDPSVGELAATAEVMWIGVEAAFAKPKAVQRKGGKAGEGKPALVTVLDGKRENNCRVALAHLASKPGLVTLLGALRDMEAPLLAAVPAGTTLVCSRQLILTTDVAVTSAPAVVAGPSTGGTGGGADTAVVLANPGRSADVSSLRRATRC